MAELVFCTMCFCMHNPTIHCPKIKPVDLPVWKDAEDNVYAQGDLSPQQLAEAESYIASHGIHWHIEKGEKEHTYKIVDESTADKDNEIALRLLWG